MRPRGACLLAIRPPTRGARVFDATNSFIGAHDCRHPRQPPAWYPRRGTRTGAPSCGLHLEDDATHEAEIGELAPGTKVGAFVVARKLGSGGMGTVYAGSEPRIEKRVAIKVMKHAFASDADQVARFLREARAVNQVGHPGIVDVFAFGTLEDGRPYLVMSLLEGRSLREELRARGRFSPSEAWSILREVADAVGAAHAAGIVHRDLKPDNVLLEKAGSRVRPRVLDFGLAKVEAKAEDVQLSVTGAPMGTPLYMAPEQWWGKGVNARTDQYALGAMLFEMLEGKPPFTSGTYVALLHQHLHDDPPSLSAPDITDAMRAFVARLLEKSGDDRFAAIKALIEAGDRAFGPAGPVSLSQRDAKRGDDDLGLAPTMATPASRTKRDVVLEDALPTPSTVPSSAPSLVRFAALHLSMIVIATALLVIIGYAGPGAHDPLEWIYMSGWPAHPVWFLAAIGLFLLPWAAKRRARTSPLTRLVTWLSLLSAANVVIGEQMGWVAVRRYLHVLDPAERFPVVYAGAYELNGLRYFGFALSSILFVSMYALPAMMTAREIEPTPLGLRVRESAFNAALLALACAISFVLDARSAAWVAFVCAALFAISAALPLRRTEHSMRDEVWRSVFGVLAVVFALLTAFARLEGRDGYLWTGEVLRADRAEAVIARAAERDLSVLIIVVCVVIFGAAELLRIARLRGAGLSFRLPRAPEIAAAVAVIGILAADFTFSIQVRDFKAEMAAHLAPQLALLAHLDPPGGDALGAQGITPHAAPALQISRDAIAVQGRRVALVSAIDTEASRSSIANALCPAIAAAEPEPEAPHLSVLADRSVSTSVLGHALGIARACGAEHAELLLTRGIAPRIPADAPLEAANVMPTDFVAIRAHLAEEGAPAEGATYADAVRPWIELARRGDLVQIGTAQ